MITSAEEFIALRTSDDPELYLRAAHELAPDVVWLELIEHHPEMRFWVAYNKTVPMWVPERLASDRDRRVRSMVAMKNKATSALLASLAADEDSGIRLSVACHPNTSAEVLRGMVNDAWEEVANKARERLQAM